MARERRARTLEEETLRSRCRYWPAAARQRLARRPDEEAHDAGDRTDPAAGARRGRLPGRRLLCRQAAARDRRDGRRPAEGERSGEVRYSAPTIAARRSYRLAGRRDLESGAVAHELRLIEAGSSEERFLEWARAGAAARVCALRDARLAGAADGDPAAETTFALVDRQTSCYPREDCDTYADLQEALPRQGRRQEDKARRARLPRLRRVLALPERARLYEIAIDDRALRDASPLAEA